MIIYPCVSESSNLDGSRVVTHKIGATNLINFLAVHQDSIYYFDEKREVVTSFNKSS